MSEPTIQELIDEFRNEVWSEACNADGNVEEARSALLSHINALQQETDEWHKMAEQFYKLLLNYAKFDTVEAGIVFGNYMLKYHNLAKCCPHAHPSEDTSVEGTIINHPTKCAHCGKIVDSIDMFIHYSPTEWWCRKCTVEGTEVKE